MKLNQITALTVTLALVSGSAFSQFKFDEEGQVVTKDKALVVVEQPSEQEQQAVSSVSSWVMPAIFSAGALLISYGVLQLHIESKKAMARNLGPLAGNDFVGFGGGDDAPAAILRSPRSPITQSAMTTVAEGRNWLRGFQVVGQFFGDYFLRARGNRG